MKVGPSMRETAQDTVAIVVHTADTNVEQVVRLITGAEVQEDPAA